MRYQTGKSPRNQIIGLHNKEAGEQFEKLIIAACDFYRDNGIAEIDKTPEPMKALYPIDNGKFVACFTKRAQPDFKGCEDKAERGNGGANESPRPIQRAKSGLFRGRFVRLFHIPQNPLGGVEEYEADLRAKVYDPGRRRAIQNQVQIRHTRFPRQSRLAPALRPRGSAGSREECAQKRNIAERQET